MRASFVAAGRAGGLVSLGVGALVQRALIVLGRGGQHQPLHRLRRRRRLHHGKRRQAHHSQPQLHRSHGHDDRRPTGRLRRSIDQWTIEVTCCGSIAR